MKYITLILLCIIANTKAWSNDSLGKYDTFTIYSQVLQQTRTINVYLPEIQKDSQKELPVLYMADGGIEEDFSHVATTLKNLIDTKQIPPVILVGIENIQRRYDLTSPSDNTQDQLIAPKIGGAQKFRDFIANELFDAIDQKYPTSHKKGILGESLAGLFVLETLMIQPTLFDYYISFDASLWWNDYALVQQAKNTLSALPNKPIYLWFTASNTEGIKEATQQLAHTFEQLETGKLKWNYTYQEQENHSTIFASTKQQALVWILNQH